jgi:hypothetical protein
MHYFTTYRIGNISKYRYLKNRQSIISTVSAQLNHLLEIQQPILNITKRNKNNK